MDPSVFAQYGAIGVIAGLALAAVKVMFKREVAAYDRERLRADRLEEELKQLNTLIRDQYMTTIAQATRSIADANEAVANALSAVRRDSR